MSLINDMLKDLDQRNQQLAVARCASQRGHDQRYTILDNPSTNRFWSICLKGMTFTILLAGFSFGSTALNQSAQSPNQSQLGTVSSPMSHQSATTINSILKANLNNNENEIRNLAEPIVASSKSSDTRPGIEKVNTAFSLYPPSANSTTALQTARAKKQIRLDEAATPEPQQWAMSISSTLQENIDKNENNSHYSAEPINISSQSSDSRPPIAFVNANFSQHSPSDNSLASLEPAQALNQPQLKKNISPKLIPPEKIAKTPLIENLETVEKKKLHNTIEPHPSSIQISDPRAAKDNVAFSQYPPSADTQETNHSAYIEVTHRPLTVEQQFLRDFHVAANTFKQGNYAESERLLEDLLARDNGQHRARLLLARLYSQQDLDSRAELVLYDGLLHFPQYAPYVSLYAQLLAEQGRDSLAIDTLENALPGAHDNADIHALLAGLYQRNGNSAAAVENYLTALRLEPTRGEWWVGLGISSEQVGDRDTAENAYNEAMQHALISEVEQYAEQRLQQIADSTAASQAQDTK